MPKGVYDRAVKTWEDVERRFRAKLIIRDTGCWEWQGSLSSTGYGMFRFNGKATSTHRVAWELAFGPIPAGVGYHGMCVLHRCDNKICCNPEHLFLGSNSDNINDKVQKGRSWNPVYHCEKHPRAKLSVVDILEIRRLGNSFSQRKIAAIYGMDQTTIGAILLRRIWKEIP